MIPEVPVSSRQIAKIRTFDKGEILITHSIEEDYDKMESDMNLIIKEKKKEYSNDQINIESIVKVGSIVGTIVKFIKNNDVDIIVFGNRGLSGLSGF